MPQASFDIQLLGRFGLRAEAGATVLTIASPRRRALIAYLAMQPDMNETRERLAALLWGDSGDRRARQSLRQALVALREDFGGSPVAPLLVDRDLVGFDPRLVRVDARELLVAAEHDVVDGRHPGLFLYQGPFLHGVDLPIEGFEEWLTAQRDRISLAAASLLRRAIAHADKSGDGAQAIMWAGRLVDLDPDQEEAHRLLIRLLARHRSRADALAQADVLKARLREELGVSPDADTRALIAEIRDRPSEDRVLIMESGGHGDPPDEPAPGPVADPAGAVDRSQSVQPPSSLWQARLRVALAASLIVGLSVATAAYLTLGVGAESLRHGSEPGSQESQTELASSGDPQLDDLLSRGWAAIVRSPREGLPNGPAAFFEMALGRAPDNPMAAIGFAASQILPATQLMGRHREFDLKRAGELLDRVLDAHPDHARALMYRAMLRRLNNDLPGARDDIIRSIGSSPGFANAYGQAGHILYRLGEYDRGLDYVRRAIRLSPNNPSLGVWTYTAGMIEFERRHDELAAEWFARAKGIIPQSIYPRLGLIAIKTQSGDVAGAQAELRDLHARAAWVSRTNLEDCLGVQATPVNTRPRLIASLNQAFTEGD